jgi:hypothetical protein
VDIGEIRRLYNELDSTAAEDRKIGRTAATLLAMIVSAVPVVGGSISIALDKIADKLFKPDVEEHLKSIERELLGVAPHANQIETLEDRVRIFSEVLSAHAEILQTLKETVAAILPGLVDEFVLNNLGGVQEVTKVVINDMHLVSTATNGATTSLDEITLHGPARFDTDHARQSISNSYFSGRTQGIASVARIGNVELGQGTVEHHVIEGDKFSGIRVQRDVGPNDPGGPTLRVYMTVGKPPGRK